MAGSGIFILKCAGLKGMISLLQLHLDISILHVAVLKCHQPCRMEAYAETVATLVVL